MSAPVCLACEAAIRTATAALEVLDDKDVSNEDRRVAAEELARAGDRLWPPTGLHADARTDQ